MKAFFNKMTIIGVGLIGGSFALRARERKLAQKIVGMDRNGAHLEVAKSRGIIDEAFTDVAPSVAEADIVLIATPPDAVTGIAKSILPFLKPGAYITDVSSIKGFIVEEFDGFWPLELNFVSSHPIAGGHRAGPEAADGTIFENATCILTPSMSTTPHALETMRNVWEEMGCHVFQMDPDEHDAVYARISHLPQIISYALMRVAEDKEKSIPFFHHLPGPGWKDMTRLSRSNPELWTNICKGNREHILSSIHRFIGEMQAIQYELLQEQWDRIKNTFGESQMMALRLSDRGEV